MNFGAFAGVCTTCAFIPQVIKLMKTKNTKSISLYMYLIQITGLTLWIIHGVRNSDPALILANSFTLLLSLIILYYKIKYK